MISLDQNHISWELIQPNKTDDPITQRAIESENS